MRTPRNKRGRKGRRNRESRSWVHRAGYKASRAPAQSVHTLCTQPDVYSRQRLTWERANGLTLSGHSQRRWRFGAKSLFANVYQRAVSRSRPACVFSSPSPWSLSLFILHRGFLLSTRFKVKRSQGRWWGSAALFGDKTRSRNTMSSRARVCVYKCVF